MASNLIIARGATSSVPPISLAFWRWLFCFLILLPFAYPFFKKILIPIKKSYLDYLFWAPLLVEFVVHFHL